MFKLFAILSLSFIVVKRQQTFLTQSNQHIHNINQEFYGETNNFGNMLFTSDLKKHYTYTFKDMLLVPDKRDFIMANLKEVKARETKNHWTLTKIVKLTISTKTKIGKSRLFCLFGI